MPRPSLNATILRSILDYNPDTGAFHWRERLDRSKRWNTRYAGKVAGYDWHIGNVAYRSIRIFDWPFLGHRLAWLYMTGSWPASEVDHIDLNGLNNAWANLRAANKRQNGANRRAASNNKLGIKGVRRTSGNRYSAAICGKYLGTFKTTKEASAAYQAAAIKMFGPFGRAV